MEDSTMEAPMAVSVANFGGQVNAENLQWDEFAATDELRFRRDRVNAAEIELANQRALMDACIARHMPKMGSAKIADRIGVTRQTVYNSLHRAQAT